MPKNPIVKDHTNHSDEEIIALYKDHTTSEQLHSEFKTDLDIERLPSGKFATNDLIMTLNAYSYNILRWIGLIGLVGNISPVRDPTKRRRIKTVIHTRTHVSGNTHYNNRPPHETAVFQTLFWV